MPQAEPDLARSTPFVGREAELAILRGQLERTPGGALGAVLIAGEPGIGKTRLVTVLSEEAQRRGVLPLWGRCHEGEGAPAYWPWVQILRAYLRAAGPGAARAALEGGAGEIARIVPEVAGLPATLLVDARSRLRARWLGELPEAALRQRLPALLATL